MRARRTMLAALGWLVVSLLTFAFLAACESPPRDVVDGAEGEGEPVDGGGEIADGGGGIADGGGEIVDGGGEIVDGGGEDVDSGGEIVDAGGEGGDEGYFSSDRDEFFGAPRCPPFVELCDDFEGDAVDSSLWSLRVGGDAALRVDAEQAARGSRALHVTLPPFPQEAYLRNESLFPRASNLMWGRLFFFIEDPGPDAFVHWNLVEATGPGDGFTSLVRYGAVAVRDRPNNFDFENWLFNHERRPRPGGFNELAIREDGEPIRRGQWLCMEWMFDGAATEARVFRDGVEVEGARGGSPLGGVDWQMPVFDGIHIGFAHYQPLDREMNVWIDGVALDDERIGCSN